MRGGGPARGGQRGFTLLELVVVVAIIGVLVTLSVTMLRGRPRAIDLAHDLSTRIGEASRKAVAAGAVRADVALALGSAARTQVVLKVGSGGGGTLVMERLAEDALPASTATWEPLAVIPLPKTIRVAGTRDAADLSGQGFAVAAQANDKIEIKCYPDGRCDGKTIYLETTDHRRKARVAVMPVGGAPVTFTTWGGG